MMTFKSSLLAALATVAVLASPLPAAAQEGISDAEISAIIEAARSEMRASREQLLAVNLSLTQAEADAFWPLYRQYNTEKARLGDDRLKIIKDYAMAYPDVDDATAASLVDRSVKNNRAMNKLKDQYVGKFRKVLPPVKLMRFLQIEARIDNLVELQVQRSIPVVEPAGPGTRQWKHQPFSSFCGACTRNWGAPDRWTTSRAGFSTS